MSFPALTASFLNARQNAMIAFILCSCLAFHPVALGHGEIHERIQDVTKEIASDPDNANLYLKRGELYRQHEKWQEALADLDKAATLDSTLDLVDFHRGHLFLSRKESKPAKLHFERFLKRRPNHAYAHLFLARTFKLSKEFAISKARA